MKNAKQWIFIGLIALTISGNSVIAKSSVSQNEQYAIEKVISLYGYYYDNNRIEEWTNLFTEKAILEHYFAGLDIPYGAVTKDNDARKVSVGHWRNQLKEKGIQTRHYQSNTLLTRIDDKKISGITNFYVLHQDKNAEAPVLKHSGANHDTFIKVGTEWKILKREIHIDHAF